MDSTPKSGVSTPPASPVPSIWKTLVFLICFLLIIIWGTNDSFRSTPHSSAAPTLIDPAAETTFCFPEEGFSHVNLYAIVPASVDAPYYKHVLHLVEKNLAPLAYQSSALHQKMAECYYRYLTSADLLDDSQAENPFLKCAPLTEAWQTLERVSLEMHTLKAGIENRISGGQRHGDGNERALAEQIAFLIERITKRGIPDKKWKSMRTSCMTGILPSKRVAVIFNFKNGIPPLGFCEEFLRMRPKNGVLPVTKIVEATQDVTTTIFAETTCANILATATLNAKSLTTPNSLPSAASP
ncbi:MAG: hypothetical protein ABW189_05525 [Rickettsiales bacterium]